MALLMGLSSTCGLTLAGTFVALSTGYVCPELGIMCVGVRMWEGGM